MPRTPTAPRRRPPRPAGAEAPPAPAASATAAAPERVGFTDAFRQSIRPVNVREDIAALPWIATHTQAIWLPSLITIGGTIATSATGATTW